MADVTTRHFVVDIQSGMGYGLKLDAKGQCTVIQPLGVVFERQDRTVAGRFGAHGGFADLPGSAPKVSLPFGQTTYAVEIKDGGSEKKLFTIVWPKKEDADKGILPKVAVKTLPENLMDAGIAARVAGDAKKGFDDSVLQSALKSIDEMIGLDGAKREIRQNIALARFNQAKIEMGLAVKPISRHMVFTGNPGTGKTTFAREVAKVYHALGLIEKPEVLEVKREDLVGAFIGQTEDKVKKVLESAKGGILFIDEAYALIPEAGGGDGKDFGRRAVDTLVAAMENMRENLVVIVAGYTAPMKQFIDSNPGLKSRFLTYIDFQDYEMPQLEQIMDLMLKDRGYKMADDARDYAMKLLREERARSKKDFGNGRTVRNLVEKAEKEMAMRLERELIFDPESPVQGEARKIAMTTITLADMQKVTLQGLAGEKRMSFGSDEPANDKATPGAAAGFRARSFGR